MPPRDGASGVNAPQRWCQWGHDPTKQQPYYENSENDQNAFEVYSVLQCPVVGITSRVANHSVKHRFVLYLEDKTCSVLNTYGTLLCIFTNEVIAKNIKRWRQTD